MIERAHGVNGNEVLVQHTGTGLKPFTHNEVGLTVGMVEAHLQGWPAGCSVPGSKCATSAACRQPVV